MAGKDALANLMQKVAQKRTDEMVSLQRDIKDNILKKFLSDDYLKFADKATVKNVRRAYPKGSFVFLSPTKKNQREHIIREAVRQIVFYREMNKVYHSVGSSKLHRWGPKDEYGFTIDEGGGYFPGLEITAVNKAVREFFPEYSEVFSRMLFHPEPPFFVQNIVNLLLECSNTNLEKAYLYTFTANIPAKDFSEVIDLPVSYLYQTFLKRSES